MGVVFVLLPLALLFMGIVVTWFVWAVRSGQFDDLETPAVRILFDDPGDRARESQEPSGQPAGGSDSAERASTKEVEIR